jgi:hypothetical protein
MKRLVKKSKFLVCISLFVLLACSQDKELIHLKQKQHSNHAVQQDTAITNENLSLEEDTIPQQIQVITLFSRG